MRPMEESAKRLASEISAMSERCAAPHDADLVAKLSAAIQEWAQRNDEHKRQAAKGIA